MSDEDGELKALQIEIRRDETELEVEALRAANRRLNLAASARRARARLEATTAGSFAVAGVAIISAAGIEPFLSTAVAVVAMVGAFFGLAKLSGPPALRGPDEE